MHVTTDMVMNIIAATAEVIATERTARMTKTRRRIMKKSLTSKSMYVITVTMMMRHCMCEKPRKRKSITSAVDRIVVALGAGRVARVGPAITAVSLPVIAHVPKRNAKRVNGRSGRDRHALHLAARSAHHAEGRVKIDAEAEVGVEMTAPPVAGDIVLTTTVVRETERVMTAVGDPGRIGMKGLT